MSELDSFIKGLHPSSDIISYGKATVMDRTVDAVMVYNLYNQKIVWGLFSVDNRKGKFVGKIANDANTEGVSYSTLRFSSTPIGHTEECVEYLRSKTGE